MKAKLIKILTVASLSVASLSAVIGVAISRGLKTASLIKAGDTRYVEITAEDVKAAIGDASSGEATIAGLRWAFVGASYADGVATFKSGNLYNIDHAGETVNPETGLGGGGFKSLALYDYVNTSGAHFEARNRAGQVKFQSDPGVDSEPEYIINFELAASEYKLTQVFFAFGGGDGVSFSKVRFYYDCVEFQPEIEISADATSLHPGEQMQVNYEVKFSDLPLTDYLFSTSDDNVITIDENTGLLTAEGHGTATVTLVGFIGGHAYQSNELEFTVSNLEDIGKLYGIRFGGEVELPDHRGEILYWSDHDIDVHAIVGGVEAVFTAGGQFWSNQLFYSLPYGERYDTYAIDLTVKSTVSGYIQVNGDKFAVEAGVAKQIRFASFTASTEPATALSIALGAWDGGEILPSGSIQFTKLRVYDLNTAYHTVEFDVDDMAVYHELVKHNKAVFKGPQDPEAPAGKVFKGWYDEHDVKLSSSYLITENTRFDAVFADEGDLDYYDVTVCEPDGAIIQNMNHVLEGTVLELANFEAPLYRKILGVYTDQELNNDYDFAPLASNLTLYVKLGVAATGTYREGGSYKIEDEYFSNAEDGALHLSGLAPLASGDSYFYQVNFDLPLGDADVTYVVEFGYKINVEGGVAKVCDGPGGGYAVIQSENMTIDANYQHVYFEYTGTLHTGAKVSFELGSIRGETPIDLLINGIVTYEKP